MVLAPQNIIPVWASTVPQGSAGSCSPVSSQALCRSLHSSPSGGCLSPSVSHPCLASEPRHGVPQPRCSWAATLWPSHPPSLVPAFPSLVWPLLCFPGCHLPLPSLFFAPLLSLCATDGPWQRTWLWPLRRALAFALPVPPWHHPLHVLFVTQGSFPAGVSDWPLGWVDVCLCTAHCGGWQPGDHPGSLPRLLPCAPAPWMFLSAVSEHRGFENHPAVGDTVEELLHRRAPGAAGTMPALGSSWRFKPWL